MKEKKAQQPNWRPNFRLVEELPDIKVIRTDFLVNFAGAFLALAAAAWAVFTYLETTGTEQEVESLRQQIANRQPDNRQFIEASGEFGSQAKLMNQMREFFAQPYRTQDLLITLADIQPDDIQLDRISMQTREPLAGQPGRRFVVMVTGVARNLDIAEEYQSRLADLEVMNRFEGNLEPLVGDVSLVTGLRQMTMTLTLRDPLVLDN